MDEKIVEIVRNKILQQKEREKEKKKINEGANVNLWKFQSVHVFSRVHATLHFAVSVARSVGRSVGPSVRHVFKIMTF